MVSIRQSWSGPVTVHGNNPQVGIFVSDDETAKIHAWMSSIASDSTAPTFPDGPFPGGLVESIFSSQKFRRCFTRQSHTLVLEGKLGVGKTTTMHGILRKLHKVRDDDQARSTNDTQAMEVTTPRYFETLLTRFWLFYLSGLLFHLAAYLQLLIKVLPRFRGLGNMSDTKPAVARQVEEVIELDLQRPQWRDVTEASMFFNADQPEEQEPAKVLMLLLQQFANQIPCSMDHVRTLWEKHKGSTPPVEDVADALISVLGTKRHACIFLDGLDECTPKYLSTLLRELKRVQEVSRMGLLLTDRIDTSKWRSILGGVPLHRIYENASDIQQYLEERLTEQGRNAEQYEWANDRSLRDKIKSTIADASGGIFLLAKLHIDFVCEARGETDVETDLSAIEKITCDNRSDDDHHINDVLNKAYHRNITRITKQSDRRNRRDAKHTLAFMRDAVRPLAVQELLQLLSVHVSEQTTRLDSAPLWSTVQHFCQGLIEKNESGIVQYLHQTLRCYLKSPDGLDLLPRLDEELGKRCVAYLTFDFCPTGVCRDTESFEMRLQQWPLLEYAARYWQIHMARFEQAKAGRISDRDYQAGSLHATALQFLGKDLHVESTFQIRSLPDRRLERSSRPDLRISSIRLLLVIEVKKVKQQLFVPNQTAGIHAACLFGLSTLVDRLTKGPRSESLDRRDSNGRYPLHFATEGNCADLVEDLIKAGADPNCRDASGVTPLILAQATGCDRVATVFTKLGDIVDINAQTKHMPKHTIYRSEVELFRQESGLARSTVVQSLVGVGGRTALHHAARSGDVPRLRGLLQDKRLNKELRDSEGNTALHKAAKKGHLEAFKVLIAAGADLDKTIDCPGDDWHENTCLHLASMYKRCDAVVRCILDLQPSRCNAVNAAGQSPLHLAATFNQTSHVRHLLAQDAIQVNLPDIEGFTPLHYATPNKSPLVMMKLLQRKDLRVNIQSKRGQSPLHLAASYGQAENVKTLLNQEGIKVNLLDEDGCSPLFEAARSGWRYAFVMLWEHPETDRDLRNARGETILETLEMDTDARKPHRVVLDILKHYHAHLAAIEDATDGLDDGVPDMPDPVKCTCRRALTSKYGLTELETRG